MKHYALVVAGGVGTRMGADLPKQFLALAGKPILMHTLEKFAPYTSKSTLILVLPTESIPIWHELLEKSTFTVPHLIVKGGKTRIESVRNGLQAISEKDSIVAIHDGVRPLVSPEIIQKGYQIAEEKGNAITCVLLKDSIRYVDAHSTKALERQHYRLVQTPQTFLTKDIYEAYTSPNIENLTDDASVWEASGRQVYLIDGSYENIKITTPEDMQVAEAFISLKIENK